MAKIVKLRQQAAELLGYKNYSEWVLEVRMAKTPETVFDFLSDLESKLKPMGEAERKKLLDLKKSEHEKRGLDFDGTFYLWDYRYYDRLWTERELNLGQCAFHPQFIEVTDDDGFPPRR